MSKYTEYCSILGLASVETEGQLKEGYRRAIKKWHPDRCVSVETDYQTAVEKAKLINLAYKHLHGLLKAGSVPKPNNRKSNTQKTPWYKPGFPGGIIEIRLKSLHIVSTGYDYEEYNLFLKFANTSIYKYLNVPPRVFDEFIAAESPGRFASKNIYPRYRFVRCRD